MLSLPAVHHTLSLSLRQPFSSIILCFFLPVFPPSLLFLLHRCTIFFTSDMLRLRASKLSTTQVHRYCACIVRSVGIWSHGGPWCSCCPGAWNSALFPGKGTIRVHAAMQYARLYINIREKRCVKTVKRKGYKINSEGGRKWRWTDQDMRRRKRPSTYILLYPTFTSIPQNSRTHY